MTLKEFKIQKALGLITFDDECDMARHTDTPISMLEVLSKSNRIAVRYYVAMNTNTPVKILKKLSKDNSSGIVKNAATDNIQFNFHK